MEEVAERGLRSFFPLVEEGERGACEGRRKKLSNKGKEGKRASYRVPCVVNIRIRGVSYLRGFAFRSRIRKAKTGMPKLNYLTQGGEREKDMLVLKVSRNKVSLLTWVYLRLDNDLILLFGKVFRHWKFATAEVTAVQFLHMYHVVNLYSNITKLKCAMQQ